MIKFIKTGRNHYFEDTATGKKLKYYQPNLPTLQLVMRLEDGSKLYVSAENINVDEGNVIFFEYGKDKYIVDDGYQDILIECGYIVMNDCDKWKNMNKNEGVSIRNKLITTAIEAAESASGIDNVADKNFSISFYLDGFAFTVNIDTVSSIVTKNQNRKEKKLSFYPFDSKMDKFGTLYISIFAKRREEKAKDSDKFAHAVEFVNSIVDTMNEMDKQNHYYYSPLAISKRLIRYGEIKRKDLEDGFKVKQTKEKFIFYIPKII